MNLKNIIFSKVADTYVKIFARRRFAGVNRTLFHLAIRGMGIHNWKSSFVSGEDYLIMKLLPLLLAKNRPIFFDIGANTGGYSAMLRAAFPNAVIHAFEPHPATFNRLVQNNAENFMHCHNAALGDNAGTMTLFDCANPSGSCFASLNRSVISQMNDSRVLEYRVEVQTLDDFAAKNKINSIDLLKIDTEGWEFSVLKGSHRLIQNHSIKCIQFEFNCQNVQTRVFFSDFQKLLPNYIFFRLLPSGLFPLNNDPLLTELFGYQNILAISKDEASGL